MRTSRPRSRAHLESEIDRLIADGMPPDEARAAARREFGNVTRARERFHDAHRAVWLELLGQDLRYAWRGLRQSRAFFATTVMTLAVGTGLVTVVFAILNAYVLRPFAVHDGRELDLQGRKLVVIGVLRPEFVGLDDAPRDLWVPLTMYDELVEEALFSASQSRVLHLTGRLRHGVTRQQAEGAIALAPFETRVSGRVDASRHQSR